MSAPAVRSRCGSVSQVSKGTGSDDVTDSKHMVGLGFFGFVFVFLKNKTP